MLVPRLCVRTSAGIGDAANERPLVLWLSFYSCPDQSYIPGFQNRDPSTLNPMLPAHSDHARKHDGAHDQPRCGLGLRQCRVAPSKSAAQLKDDSLELEKVRHTHSSHRDRASHSTWRKSQRSFTESVILKVVTDGTPLTCRHEVCSLYRQVALQVASVRPVVSAGSASFGAELQPSAHQTFVVECGSRRQVARHGRNMQLHASAHVRSRRKYHIFDSRSLQGAASAWPAGRLQRRRRLPNPVRRGWRRSACAARVRPRSQLTLPFRGASPA